SGIPGCSSSTCDSHPFYVDAHTDPVTLTACASSNPTSCPYLQIDTTGELYGYGSGWTNTNFRRSVKVSPVAGAPDEFVVASTVEWQTAAFQVRTFTISENLYNWFNGNATST